MKVKLGDVCQSIDTIDSSFQGLIDYIDISSVDNKEKRVTGVQTMDYSDAPSRARQLIRKDDILVSTVRPNLNAVALVDFSSNNTMVASTGYCVLRCKPGVNPRYIFYYCQSQSFVDDMTKQATGASYPAVNSNIVKSSLITLPSEPEQTATILLLDKISSLVYYRKQQLQKLDELVKARFVEMFGAEQEVGRWPSCVVADVADVTVGVVIQPTQYYCDYGVPAFRSLNVREMAVNDNDWVYFTEEGQAKNQKSIIRENDVLVVRSGAPGVACVATAKYAGYNAVDIIIAHPCMEKVNPVFLAMFTNMPHGMNQIRAKTGGAAQQHYNVGGYKALKLILPPLDLQNEFAAFVSQVDKSKLSIQASLDQLETLKQSLMQKYFG